MKQEITITEVKDYGVSYFGSKYSNGWFVGNFPKTPGVGEVYILETLDNDPCFMLFVVLKEEK